MLAITCVHHVDARGELEDLLAVPGPRIRPRIVEDEVNLQGILGWASDALGDAQRLRIGMTEGIEPALIVQTQDILCLDDESVAVPAPMLGPH